MAKATPVPVEPPTPKKVTAADLRAQAQRLTADAEALEAEAWAKAHAPQPVTSDEGVKCSQISPIELVNIDTRGINPTRFELHLGGRTYTHCSESGGHWLYRTV